MSGTIRRGAPPRSRRTVARRQPRVSWGDRLLAMLPVSEATLMPPEPWSCPAAGPPPKSA